MRVLPTRWRRKPAGVDMSRNYVTVTLAYILAAVDSGADRGANRPIAADRQVVPRVTAARREKHY